MPKVTLGYREREVQVAVNDTATANVVPVGQFLMPNKNAN
jgi:hypothetical protein